MQSYQLISIAEEQTSPTNEHHQQQQNFQLPKLEPLRLSKQFNTSTNNKDESFNLKESNAFPPSPASDVSPHDFPSFHQQRNSPDPAILTPAKSLNVEYQDGLLNPSKLNSSNLHRSQSAQEYATKSKTVNRTLSTSSYQESPITPSISTQSTPDIYGGNVKSGSSDWASFFSLTPDFLADLDKPTISLQNEIHHLISTEENYVQNTKVFLQVFGDGLSNTIDKGGEKFRQNAFVPLEHVVEANDKILLKALKEEQNRNGPLLNFIPGAMRDWASAVREPILWYAECYPYASEEVRIQKQSNERFKAFIEHGSAESVRKVQRDFSSLFENTRTRFGQYSLILKNILKEIRKLDAEDPMICEIEECIEACAFTLAKYNEIQGKVGAQLQMSRLSQSLKFKYPEDEVDLKLTEGDHEILYQSKVMLKKHEIDTLDNLEMILLDHYLLLVNIKSETYYSVTTKPIHLEILAIESHDDDPLFKSNTKAVVSKLTRNKSETNGGSSLQGSTVGSLSSAPSSRQSSVAGESSYFSRRHRNSGSGSVSSTSGSDYYNGGFISQNNDMLYPIKLRNLATDQKYYICTTSQITRREWVKRLSTAKAKYSERTHNQHHEPFSLRIIDCSSFGYNQMEIPKQTYFTKSNALDRALELQKTIVSGGQTPQHSTTNGTSASTPGDGSTPINSASLRAPKFKSTTFIHCVTEVTYSNLRILFLGLNDCIYGCQLQSTGTLNWVLVDRLPRVIRLEAVPDKNFLFVLSEKTLFAYKLNEILISIMTQGSFQSQTKLQISPPLLIDANVDCFKAGKLSGTEHLFYSSYTSKSTVTVLEITGKVQQKKSSRLFSFKSKAPSNEFKESDWLFTPTRNRKITFFNSTFCIHTDTSFEVMNLELKQPSTIPSSNSILSAAKAKGLAPDQAELLKKRVSESRPIFIDKIPSSSGRSGTSDFILCYHKLAIICNALGNLTSATTINYLRKITAAYVWYPYLVTFSDRIIEIHKINGGGPNKHQLVQVITGRDIRMLGCTQPSPGSGNSYPRLIVAMAHPEQARSQLLLEFELNENVEQNQDGNSLVYI